MLSVAGVSVTFCPGRIRMHLHILLVALLVYGGYLWFGTAGAAIFLLWGRSAAPKRKLIDLQIHLERVAEIRLYTKALVIREFRKDFRWIFADEIPPEDFAAVRRRLKS